MGTEKTTMTQITPYQLMSILKGYRDLVSRILTFPMPTVAVLNGKAIQCSLLAISDFPYHATFREKGRVAEFACPYVLDDQKMSEDNQKLRSGCPPDYQIFLEKYFEYNCPYKFFKDLILTLSFSNKHISFGNLKQIAYRMVLK